MAAPCSAHNLQGQLQVKLHLVQDALHLQTQLWDPSLISIALGFHSGLPAQQTLFRVNATGPYFITAFKWHHGHHTGKRIMKTIAPFLTEDAESMRTVHA